MVALIVVSCSHKVCLRQNSGSQRAHCYILQALKEIVNVSNFIRSLTQPIEPAPQNRTKLNLPSQPASQPPTEKVLTGSNLDNKHPHGTRLNETKPRVPQKEAIRPELDLVSSEKPRIQFGCPSRSTLSQLLESYFLWIFGRKEYGYGTSCRGV